MYLKRLALYAILSFFITTSSSASQLCEANVDADLKNACDWSTKYQAVKKIAKEMASVPTQSNGPFAARAGVYSRMGRCEGRLDPKLNDSTTFNIGVLHLQSALINRRVVTLNDRQLSAISFCCLNAPAALTRLGKPKQSRLADGRSLSLFENGEAELGLPSNENEIWWQVRTSGKQYNYQQDLRCNNPADIYQWADQIYDAIIAYPYVLHSKKLIDTGKSNDAINVLAEGARLAPKAWQISYWQSRAFFELGNGVEALAAANAAISQQQESADALLARGKAYWLLKLQEKAVADITRVLELVPDSSEAKALLNKVLSGSHVASSNLVEQGKELFLRGKREEAVAAYSAALQTDPKNREALTERALIFSLKQSEFPKALQDYETLIQNDPGNAEAHKSRAELLVRLERTDDALAAFGKAIDLGPTKAGNLYLQRANLYRQKGMNLEALGDFERAIASDGSLTFAHFGKGDMLLVLNRVDEAIASYKKGIELSPNLAHGHVQLAEAYTILGDTANALAALDAAVQNDTQGTGYAARAYARLTAGNAEGALDDYSKALFQSPGSSAYLNGKATALSKLNRFAEALVVNDQAIAINPKAGYLYSNRGTLFEQQGDFDQATASYTKGIEVEPTLHHNYNGRGWVAYLKKQYEVAEKDFRKALSLQPTDRNVQENIGLALVARERYAEAEAYLSELLSKKKTGAALAGLAKAKLGQGSKDAAALAAEALKLDSSEPEVHIVNGEILLSAGDIAGARSAFDKAFALNKYSRAKDYAAKTDDELKQSALKQNGVAEPSTTTDVSQAACFLKFKEPAERRVSCLEIIDQARAGKISLKDHVKALVEKSQAYVRVKGAIQPADLTAGITDLSEAIKLDPKAGSAYYHRAEFFRENSQHGEALADYKSAAEIGVVGGYFGLAAYARKDGRTEESLEHYDAALKLRPNFLPTSFFRASVFVSLKKYSEAIKELDGLISKASLNGNLNERLLGLCNRAVVKELNGDSEGGLQDANAYVGDGKFSRLSHSRTQSLMVDYLWPEGAECVRVPAKVLLAQGKNDEALAAINLVVSKVYDDPVLLEARGAIQEKANDPSAICSFMSAKQSTEYSDPAATAARERAEAGFARQKGSGDKPGLIVCSLSGKLQPQ